MGKKKIKMKNQNFLALKKNERGIVLIGLLIFITFVGLIVLSLLKLLSAEAIMQVIDINEKRALYAAQSGVEYVMRGINEYSNNNSDLSGTNNYEEDLDVGPGTHCIVKINTNGNTSFTITATGYSQGYSKTIVKTVNYVDVAKYAVYATGKVRYMKTIPSNITYSHAKYFPVFDLNALRQAALPSYYHPNDFTIDGTFNYPNDVVYIGRDLTFKHFKGLSNIGNFVVGRNVKIRYSIGLLSIMHGYIYQFNPNSQFLCQVQFILSALDGGLIVNGDAYGTNIPFWPFRFIVYYNRNRITNLLRYSVNGGPLVYTTSEWRVR